MKKQEFAISFLRIAFFVFLVGIAAGLVVALFLSLLSWATNFRERYPLLLYALPILGYAIASLYARYDRTEKKASALILDRIHSLGDWIPFRSGPLVLIGTIFTHLGGGSAGREGTAVQMSASVADQMAKVAKLKFGERRTLLIAGVAAGFAAAFGAPVAGVFFGAELLHIGKMEWRTMGSSLLSSITACFVVHRLGIQHTVYPKPELMGFSGHLFFALLCAGLAFGLAAQSFVSITHGMEKLFRVIFSHPGQRAFFAGLFLVIAYQWEGSGRFVGLGFEEILRSFQLRESFSVPCWKTLFTAITLGGGYKGGEFIPLVFIGTTLGSALSLILHTPISFLAALGVAACFGAAANTPLTAAILLVECFGLSIFPYAIFVCYLAYFCTGENGIYSGQLVQRRKPMPLLFARWRNAMGSNSH